MKNNASNLLKIILSAALGLALSACDSGVDWRYGRYVAFWVDSHEDLQLGFELEDGRAWKGRVEAKLRAVGANEKYVVAKRSPPHSDQIEYYNIASENDHRFAEPRDVVFGPFTEKQFETLSQTLALPGFTREFQ